MPNVTVDGVKYVPKTDIQHVGDAAILDAVRSLVTGLYLYGYVGRGMNGCIHDAIRSLAPEIANLLENSDARTASEALGCFDESDNT